MIWDLMALQWAAVGGCAVMGCVVAGSFLAGLAGELRRVPATRWRPGGEWIPHTLPAPDTRALVLGMTAAEVEDEIARMIAANPDRPA